MIWHSSENILRMTKLRRMSTYYAWGEVRFVSVENPEEKRPLGIPRRTWEDNIKLNLKETGREMDSSG